MSSSVLVNDTVRIKVKFIDYNSTTGEEESVSPVSVNVLIEDSNNETVASTSATSLTSSEYYYDFTPTESGQYSIKFTGLISGGEQIIVNQNLYVSDPDEEFKPTVTLRENETISFSADVSPIYLDPEELLSIFPDASLLEIGELIHNYSNEIKEMFDIEDSNTSPELPFTVLEYIKASAACELSRTYGFGGDDELSVQLGDFQITNRSAPRSVATRSNATTWCQIAASLRREILAKKVYLKGVVPKGLPNKTVITSGRSLDPQTGSLIYLSDRELYGPGKKRVDQDDPMPDRGLRQYD